MKRKLSNGMGVRIRRAREEMGLSREAFAEQIEVSPNFLAEVEADKKGFSTTVLCKVCEKTLLSADYLLLGREPNPQSCILFEMLSNLEPRYLDLAKEILGAFALAVGRSKCDD